MDQRVCGESATGVMAVGVIAARVICQTNNKKPAPLRASDTRNMINTHGWLAQLVRVPALHAGGRRFESCTAHHFIAKTRGDSNSAKGNCLHYDSLTSTRWDPLGHWIPLLNPLLATFTKTEFKIPQLPIAVLLGGVHGRGASEAEGPGPQGSARSHVPVRVGAGDGAGKRGRAGRRGALDRNTQGEVVATSAMASPCTAMCAGFFAFQPARFMCAALFFCPFSGEVLIPLLRSPSSASDGPSGEAAGMEANKRRLTLDLASTLQRWLKVWRSRVSACAGEVKPPSTGRPTKGEADTPLPDSAIR